MADSCFHHGSGAGIITRRSSSTRRKHVESCTPTSRGSRVFYISVSVNSKKGLRPTTSRNGWAAVVAGQSFKERWCRGLELL
jgi:hypothetical protein